MKYCNPRKTPFLLGVNIEEAKSTPLVNNTMYKQLVGCILYLTHTQPDTSYAVHVESRHMQQTYDIQQGETKRILHLVQGTKTHGIHYVAKSNLELVGFTDSDWVGDKTNRKSTFGYVFMLEY